jgi:hypothetical protein
MLGLHLVFFEPGLGFFRDTAEYCIVVRHLLHCMSSSMHSGLIYGADTTVAPTVLRLVCTTKMHDGISARDLYFTFTPRPASTSST